MIDRYTTTQMKAVWSEDRKLANWLRVELLALEAMEEFHIAPAGAADKVRGQLPGSMVTLAKAAMEREQITGHDVSAFVDVLHEWGGADAKWLHWGLTSSDIVDTAMGISLDQSCCLIEVALRELIRMLSKQVRQWADTPMAGRTHGQHAEPTTLGVKMTHWTLAFGRDLKRMAEVHPRVAVGKLSGAVGNYTTIDPRVEKWVCEALGIRAVPATQVVARDRVAEYLYVCGSIGSTVESVATEIRHLQRPELGELAEPFRPGQQGSSSMPHKRNPVTCEQLCGLARVLRGNVMAGLEGVALWGERDISHSSVERIVVPDSSQLAHFAVTKLTGVIEGLQVFPERMLTNLSAFGTDSQGEMMRAMERGFTRAEARALSEANQVSFDLGKALRHTPRIIAELDQMVL